MSLGKKIAQARERAGLTQAELARLLKKSRSSVNEWESGLHAPPPVVLQDISRVTKCSLDELLKELIREQLA